MTRMAKPHFSIGILLVNLGTPHSPSSQDVRQFLSAFLSDPRVIDLPPLLRKFLLNVLILPHRASRVAKKYQEIWTPDGSPLLVESQHIAEKLQSWFKQSLDSNVIVYLGMVYGEPSLKTALEKCKTDRIEKLLVLPLYPQFSFTTTASVFDKVSQLLAMLAYTPQLRFIQDYHDFPPYIDALTRRIKDSLGERVPWPHLIFSFHGLPSRYIRRGDPYQEHCIKTATLLAAKLSLHPSQYTIAYQSQLGRAKWLTPSTETVMRRLLEAGMKSIAIICPGFATDCLETLEEVNIRFRSFFLSRGGEVFDYLSALNASDSQIQLLVELVYQSVQDWFAEDTYSSLVTPVAKRADPFVEHDMLLSKDIFQKRPAIFYFKTLEEAEHLAKVIAATFGGVKVYVGLMELFINAIEHGNLEIDFFLKAQLLKTRSWLEEIQHRLGEPRFSNRLVRVTVDETKEHYYIDIQDEGHGFDWIAEINAIKNPHQRPHGRGIMLAQLISFEKLEYLGRGNQVRAYIKKAAV